MSHHSSQAFRLFQPAFSTVWLSSFLAEISENEETKWSSHDELDLEMKHGFSAIFKIQRSLIGNRDGEREESFKAVVGKTEQDFLL